MGVIPLFFHNQHTMVGKLFYQFKTKHMVPISIYNIENPPEVSKIAKYMYVSYTIVYFRVNLCPWILCHVFILCCYAINHLISTMPLKVFIYVYLVTTRYSRNKICWSNITCYIDHTINCCINARVLKCFMGVNSTQTKKRDIPSF